MAFPRMAMSVRGIGQFGINGYEPEMKTRSIQQGNDFFGSLLPVIDQHDFCLEGKLNSLYRLSKSMVLLATIISYLPLALPKQFQD